MQPDEARSPRRRIRVAQVITSVVLGGGGQVISAFARHIDRSAFEMDVYCVLEGGEFVEYIRSLGFRVTVVPICRERGLLRYDARLWLRLAGYLRDGQYDLVHTHLFRADLVGSLAGRVARRPSMLRTLHNMGTRKRTYHRVIDWVLDRAFYDRVVCVSASQRQLSLSRDRADPRKLTVISNGVDQRRFVPGRRDRSLAQGIGLNPDQPVIGTVGRLIDEKGHRLLIDAMPRIASSISGAQFLIVGDGPLRAELERSAGDCGCRLIVTGLRADVPELLGLMDVFVFPSWSEAFGIAVIEAMAAGVPVACSAIPALREFVVDEVNGLLFESGDPFGLSKSVVRLSSDEELRKTLVANGLSTVRDHYTESAMIRRYEQLYRELSDRRSVRSRA